MKKDTALLLITLIILLIIAVGIYVYKYVILQEDLNYEVKNITNTINSNYINNTDNVTNTTDTSIKNTTSNKTEKENITKLIKMK